MDGPAQGRNLTYGGRALDTSPACFGLLRRSDDALGETETLRERLAAEGYLYLPGLLAREDVAAARRAVLEHLAADGMIDERFPLLEGIAAPEARQQLLPGVAKTCAPLQRTLYAGPLMALFERLLGGEVRHYDYTWLRCKPPGIDNATQPHCDIVYMGRGTHDLYTAWVPYGDVPLEMGGLVVLEGSHCLRELREGYGRLDVDTYCANHEDADQIVSGAKLWQEWVNSGAYCADAIAAREELGGRWLGADYAAGDVVVFSMFLLHASLDNRSRAVRISTDSRYQRADQPIDERWIGEAPPAHGARAKRALIC